MVIRDNVLLSVSECDIKNGEFIIPDGVTRIGSCAFFDCAELKRVNIPNSVTSIGRWAFHGCTELTSINIPESVTSIESYAFFGCISLTTPIKAHKAFKMTQNGEKE